MKRRDFLKAGAAASTAAGIAGLAGVAGVSCAGAGLGWTLPKVNAPLPEMEAYLARVRRGLEVVSTRDLTADAGDRERDLARDALRSLYVTGMFGDLPEVGQLHPGMQRIVREQLPGMDRSIFDTCDYLAGLDQSRTKAVRNRLRREPDLGMAVAEEIDRLALDSEMSAGRRLQTRSMTTQIAWRLKHQPTELVLGDYVGKVRRLAARGGTLEEVQRQVAAGMTREEFWARQQRLALLSDRWHAAGAAVGPPTEEPVAASAGPSTDGGSEECPPEVVEALGPVDAPAELQHVVSEEERDRIAGYQVRTAGGWSLGIGAVIYGMGTALFFAQPVGAIVAGSIVGTAGAVLLLAGVAMIIAGNGPEGE